MPLPVKRILDLTPAVVKARTRVCSIRTVGQGKYINNRKLGKTYEVKFLVQCLDGQRKVTIRFVGNQKPGIDKRKQEDPEPSMQSPVWVRCSCPWFLFTCEYALAKHGSSDIYYCNGNPPVIRNPSEIPFCCKHLVLALGKAVKDWKFFANRPKKTPAPKEPSKVEVPQKPTKKRPPTKQPIEESPSKTLREKARQERERAEQKPTPRQPARSPLSKEPVKKPEAPVGRQPAKSPLKKAPTKAPPTKKAPTKKAPTKKAPTKVPAKAPPKKAPVKAPEKAPTKKVPPNKQQPKPTKKVPEKKKPR